MYEELLKKIRTLTEQETRIGLKTQAEAADAIEKLQREYDSISKSLCESVELVRKTRERVPRWIPVTERLPEPWEPVLVTYLGYNSHLPKADMLAYIDSDDGLWYWWDDTEPSGTKCIVPITHWMPLPEPPKEET